VQAEGGVFTPSGYNSDESGNEMVFDWSINLGNLLTAGGLMLAGLLYVIDTRYSASGAKAAIAQLTLDVKAIARDTEIMIDENHQSMDGMRREFGETAYALRTKITEVELFMRDNFVKNDALRDMNVAIQAQMGEIKGGVIRIEGRLDARERLFSRLQSENGL
jgi:hypothetical protein